MVLFVFVVMMLNLGPQAKEQEKKWLSPGIWRGPSILAAVLLAELIYIFTTGEPRPLGGGEVPPQAVGLALFGPYLLSVELAAMLLLAGLVGAYHIGRRDDNEAAS